MGLFLNRDGTSRSAFEIAATVLTLPVALFGLVPALVINKGRMSEDDFDALAEFGPSLVKLVIVMTCALLTFLVLMFVASTVLPEP